VKWFARSPIPDKRFLVMEVKSIQIVLDTNVLVSAARSRAGASFALLAMLGDPRWKMNVSTALILEYEANLKKEYARQGLGLHLADDILNVIVVASNHRGIFFKWRPVLRDPNDDFVVELAVASGSDFVVTYNIRHFLEAEKLGVKTIRPGDFLQLLEKKR
jgi:putative PIN family toxin of toxin-antitoxin system